MDRCRRGGRRPPRSPGGAGSSGLRAAHADRGRPELADDPGGQVRRSARRAPTRGPIHRSAARSGTRGARRGLIVRCGGARHRTTAVLGRAHARVRDSRPADRRGGDLRGGVLLGIGTYPGDRCAYGGGCGRGEDPPDARAFDCGLDSGGIGDRSARDGRGRAGDCRPAGRRSPARPGGARPGRRRCCSQQRRWPHTSPREGRRESIRSRRCGPSSAGHPRFDSTGSFVAFRTAN